MPRGAIRPSQPTASKFFVPATPLSRTAGTSGSCDERVADVTASATALPALMCGSAAVTESTISGTWLPRKSACAGPLPRYGMCVMNTCAADLYISPDRCCVPPMPALA
ncbi:hypothetical protein D9M68_384010 [compost metagenome]